MTKRNILLNNELREPFLLKPASKDYLWGGTRLNDEFSKNIPYDAVAETWECSTHKDGISIIDSGINRGTRLDDYVLKNPSVLGSRWEHLKELPILIKFIDAKKDLSIQVHPDDEYARINENGQNGKIEFWYILDANKDSKIVYGLSHDVSREEFRQILENGKIYNYLQNITVNSDDIYLIEPGLIHAIGEGILLVEVQESSNLTYRLYDYDRVDKNGKKRELHIEKALDVSNLKASDEPSQPMRVLKYIPGCASELLSRCKYFQVERIIINTERTRRMFSYMSNDLSFKVLICIKGCCSMTFSNKSLNVFKGDCIFVPANSKEIRIHGCAQFLSVTC